MIPIFGKDSADNRLEAASAEDRAEVEGVRDQPLVIADSYRMTCPVVRVTKMGEGKVEVEKDVKEEDEGWGVMANFQVELAEVEEVMPTLEDQQQVSSGVDAK